MSGTMIQPQSDVLRVADRCDRCPAQAFVRVTMASGGDLHFCGSHYKANAAALEGRVTAVVDERYKLLARPVVQDGDPVV